MIVDEPCSRQYCSCRDGMGLRDYFAAKALMGMFACAGHRDVAAEIKASKEAFCLTPQELAEATNAVVARMAYQMADAMMKAREAVSASDSGLTLEREPGEPLNRLKNGAIL